MGYHGEPNAMSNPVSPVGTAASATPDGIDFDSWRMRIKADTFARYHLEMGNALFQTGDGPAAAEAYRRAIAIMPTMAEAHCKLVALLRDLGRTNEAENAHQAAVAQDPDYDSRSWIELGVQRMLDNKIEAGLHALVRGLSIDPDNHRGRAYHALALLCSGDIEAGMAEFAAIRNNLGANTAEAAADYVEVANRMYWQTWKEWGLAATIAAADCAVTLVPDSGPYLFTLFYQEFLANRPESILARAAGTTTPNLQAFRTAALVGWAKLQLGQWAEAEKAFSDLMQRSSDAEDEGVLNFAISGHAVSVQGLGRLQEAKAMLDGQIARHPNDFNALHHRSLIALSEGRPNEALPFAERARDAGKHSPLYLADIGLCHMASGSVDRAEQLFRQALSEAGSKSRFVMMNDPWLMLNLALALEAQGAALEAAELYAAHVSPYSAMMPYFDLLLSDSARAALRRLRMAAA